MSSAPLLHSFRICFGGFAQIGIEVVTIVLLLGDVFAVLVD